MIQAFLVQNQEKMHFNSIHFQLSIQFDVCTKTQQDQTLFIEWIMILNSKCKGITNFTLEYYITNKEKTERFDRTARISKKTTDNWQP